MAQHNITRRRLLALLTHGSLLTVAIAAASQAMRFLAFQPPSAISTVFSLGRPEDYPPDGLVYVPAARAYIGRDALGFYALDAVCPHLGCLVEHQAKGGFVCPCHASRFDAAGEVLSGPATQSLPALHLWFNREQSLLLLDRAQRTEPTLRLSL